MTNQGPNPFHFVEIDERKLTKYLLISLPRDDKSKFLAQANYTLKNWRILKDDLVNLAKLGTAEYLTSTPYGDKYKIRGEFQGLKVITIWMVANDRAKFITLVPDKGVK